MVACEHANDPSAPKSALQVAWETSVLPATTAAPGMGDRNVPGGIMIFSGFRQPSFKGISSPTRQRKTYNTAACVTAGGELKLPVSCGPVPVKSTVADRVARSTLTDTHSGLPLSMV